MAKEVLSMWEEATATAYMTYEGGALEEVLQGIDDAYGPAYEQALFEDGLQAAA